MSTSSSPKQKDSEGSQEPVIPDSQDVVSTDQETLQEGTRAQTVRQPSEAFPEVVWQSIEDPDAQQEPAEQEEVLTPARRFFEYRARLLWVGQLFFQGGHGTIAEAVGLIAHRFWSRESNRCLMITIWNAMVEADGRADMKWNQDKEILWL